MPSAFSMRRLAATSAALFLMILAFLAGRVHAGADPAQVTAPVSQTATPEPYEADPYGPGTLPAPGGRDADPPVTQAS